MLERAHRAALRLALAQELEAWQSRHWVLDLWWRDDDAHQDTAALRALLSIPERPTIVLSVIPGVLEPTLSSLLEKDGRNAVIQHGWKHVNHSRPGEQPSEYPDQRSRDDIARELDLGSRVLSETFGPSFMPAFVPPWHAFSASLATELADRGYMLSVGARGFPFKSQSGVCVERNVDIDTANWEADGRFIGTSVLSVALIDGLRLRSAARREHCPLGILTHHYLLNDDDLADLGELFAFLSKSPAVNFLAPADLFSSRGPKKSVVLQPPAKPGDASRQ